MVFATLIYKNHFKILQKFRIMVFKDVSVSLNITERYENQDPKNGQCMYLDSWFLRKGNDVVLTKTAGFC